MFIFVCLDNSNNSAVGARDVLVKQKWRADHLCQRSAQIFSVHYDTAGDITLLMGNTALEANTVSS